MKILSHVLLIVIAQWIFLSGLEAQVGHNLVLRKIIHNNINYCKISPTAIQANTKEGFVEFEVNYTSNCVEKYRFEFTFDQDMSHMVADQAYGIEYGVQLISGQCNDNRTPFVRPSAPNGGFSSLAGYSGFPNLVNSMGVLSERTYAKDLGRPKVYKTGRQHGEFRSRTGALNAHTWLNFTIDGSSNVKGEGFYYEILFVYQFTDEPVQKSFDCPPPDCSGFPGTIPVWNFKTNQGECWCPEGMVWDKMKRACVPLK